MLSVSGIVLMNGQRFTIGTLFIFFFFASVLSKYYFIVFSCIRVNIPLEVEERIPVSFQSTTNRKTRPKKDCTK
jgi:hypothetical protein